MFPAVGKPCLDSLAITAFGKIAVDGELGAGTSLIAYDRSLELSSGKGPFITRINASL